MTKAAWSLALALSMSVALSAQNGPAKKVDANGNGYADTGYKVNRHLTPIYAYDYNGDWYWDLDDGRIYGTVPSIADLDTSTLTVCKYVENSRGAYNDTPYLDSGWILNTIVCTGKERGVYVYQIVHKSDPRYTGNPDLAIWGDWEYHVLTISGYGNLVTRFPAWVN
jgi:hypothetical protein